MRTEAKRVRMPTPEDEALVKGNDAVRAALSHGHAWLAGAGGGAPKKVRIIASAYDPNPRLGRKYAEGGRLYGLYGFWYVDPNSGDKLARCADALGYKKGWALDRRDAKRLCDPTRQP